LDAPYGSAVAIGDQERSAYTSCLLSVNSASIEGALEIMTVSAFAAVKQVLIHNGDNARTC
jgi:hypothetical protein